MSEKITSLALSAMLLGSASAQQSETVPRIGYLSSFGDASEPGPQIEAFRRGLRDLGYIEGKNILIEYRDAEGNLDRAPALIAELVQLKVDILVVTSLAAIRGAKQATKDNSHWRLDLDLFPWHPAGRRTELNNRRAPGRTKGAGLGNRGT